MKPYLVLPTIAVFVFFSCSGNSPIEQQTVHPLFTNSIVSTDIDFIILNDSGTFVSMKYLGQKKQEMPDRRNDELMDEGTFVFEAGFSDGSKITQF